MKISKLFHWLYATLMFLPIIFFVPSCLYYSFNEHATNTETTTINYKYESNEVNTLDDLVEGNIYSLNLQGETITNLIEEEGSYIYFELLNDINLNGSVYLEELTPSNFTKLSANTILSFDSSEYISLYDSDTRQFGDYLGCFDYSTTLQQNLIIRLIEFDNIAVEYISYTDYNVIESVSLNTDDTITDKVNRAWSSVWDLPLFAWTHNSFVAAPFSYITGLFGVGSDNTLNYVFAYFVSISICWLVFDLIMYVPNLAHRWLDRSSLE